MNGSRDFGFQVGRVARGCFKRVGDFGFDGMPADEPSLSTDFHAAHVERLAASYGKWTGRELIESTPGKRLAEAIYHSPAVILSHNTAADPLFNYANLAGLNLFEMDWATAMQTPSRTSAEPVNQDERARLMKSVTERGFIDDYRGVRISATGRRFLIERATVWNVLDSSEQLIGQAATFDEWIPL